MHELNQLELQFLLLNDFKLVIPLEEMQRYADQLLVYGGVPRTDWSESMTEAESRNDTTHTTTAKSTTTLQQEHRDEPMKGGE